MLFGALDISWMIDDHPMDSEWWRREPAPKEAAREGKQQWQQPSNPALLDT